MEHMLAYYFWNVQACLAVLFEIDLKFVCPGMSQFIYLFYLKLVWSLNVQACLVVLIDIEIVRQIHEPNSEDRKSQFVWFKGDT